MTSTGSVKAGVFTSITNDSRDPAVGGLTSVSVTTKPSAAEVPFVKPESVGDAAEVELRDGALAVEGIMLIIVQLYVM